MTFLQEYINLSEKCDPNYDNISHQIWMNKEDRSIVAYVTPPHLRLIRFQANTRTKEKLIQMPVPWQIVIVRLRKNVNNKSYRFRAPLMFFLSDHPSKTNKVYDPLYPNIYTIERNDNWNHHIIEQYNCHGSTLKVHDSEQKCDLFHGRLGPTKKFYSWISSMFDTYFSTFYSGTFNCDLGQTRLHDLSDSPEDYNLEDRHHYYIHPSWTLDTVTEKDFLKREAGKPLKLDNVVNAYTAGKVYQPGSS